MTTIIIIISINHNFGCVLQIVELQEAAVGWCAPAQCHKSGKDKTETIFWHKKCYNLPNFYSG